MTIPQTTRRTAAQTSSSRASPSPGQSADAVNTVNAEGVMKGSDVLEIPLVHMLTHRPTLRIDWDRKKVAFEFDFNAANGNADAENDPAQCIQNLCGVPDGAARPPVLAQGNSADTGCGVDDCAQPRPCQVHEAQNARASEEGSDAATAPRCTRPLPRRNQIVNGTGSVASTVASARSTQAGASYDNTNTPPASSNSEGSGGDDDDDDDIPLNKLKEKAIAKKKRKAKAAPATFEPVIKIEPVEKECGKRLHPERHQFKIRGLDERVRWYYTKSKRPIDAVPEGLLKPRHEALYVHRFSTPFVGRQVWIYVKFAGANRRVQAGANAGGSSGNRDGSGSGSGNGNGGEGGEREDGEWRRMELGDPHPRLEGLMLHVLDENEPRWVKPQSARNYANGKHKRARWARNM